MKKSFVELRLTDKLPSSPGIGTRILKLTQRDDCSADEIAAVLRADPASIGRLLRRVNDARAPSDPPISTVESAVQHLGMPAVREVALDLSLLSAHGSSRCKEFDYGRHWSMALVRAIAARRISAGMSFGKPGEAYVLGLLAEIGCLVLASLHPEEFARILAARGSSSRAEQCRAEREKFEIDHVEVAAYLMEAWGLPSMFGQALQMFATMEATVHSGNREAAGYANILHSADSLAEIHVKGGPTDAASQERLAHNLERLRKRLDLDAPAFHAFCNRIGDEWFEQGCSVDLAPGSRDDVVRFMGELTDRCAAPRVVPNFEKAWSPRTPLSAKTGESSASEAKRAPNGLRILAVDDDPLLLKLLERTLLKAGHQVLCAPDGGRALEIAIEANPQVVIADWMMPQMDGIELCKALRRIDCGRDMFYILLTGRAEEDRVVEAFDAGIDDYVVKPFNSRVLMARIKGGHRVIELKAKVENDRQLIMRQVAELGQLTRKLDTAAHTDVLTSLPNRRYIMTQLEREWESAVKADKPLAVIMIDIDHFKKVNDVYGHDVGDLVLRETARVLRDTSRQGEVLARLGGEEFLIVCTNSTEDQAVAGAERLRAAIEAHRIESPSFQGSVTISLGVAGRNGTMRSIDAFLKAADGAVYEAKRGGRNRVTAAGRAVDRETKSA
jgi:diguanylate cyclase (GGDEF)-like protein